MIVKKFKSLHSSSGRAGTTERKSVGVLQDSEARFITLKVRLARAKRNPGFLIAPIQKPQRNYDPPADKTASDFVLHSTPTFPPLTYYAVEPHSAG